MGSSDDFTRKAIHFDLDTDSLKKIFHSNNPFVYLKGYKQIGDFLKKNGFTHRQWSGYISKDPLTPVQVTAIVKGLNKTLPWLKKCVRKFDVTNVGDTFDLMYIFDKSKIQLPTLEQEAKQTDKSKQHSQKSVLSRTTIKRNAAIISEKTKTTPKKEQNKYNVR